MLFAYKFINLLSLNEIFRKERSQDPKVLEIVLNNCIKRQLIIDNHKSSKKIK